MIWPRVPRFALAIGVATLSVVAGACGPTAGTPGPSASLPAASGSATTDPSVAPTASAASYRLGVSNTLVADGWRRAMICSINAEALASGRVSRVTLADRDTDGAGQAADIGNLVATGVDAIVLYPSDPGAIKDAVTAAIDASVPVVSVGRPLDQDGAYAVATDQEAYGYAGARWLFQHLEGKGDVVLMHGIEGDPIDTARVAGVKRALDEFPDIKVASETHTNWDPTTAVGQLNEFLATGKDVDGIWTSGIDSVIVDALKTADAPFVPIVGADNGSFVSQLLTEPGLIGAAVTDPAAVGGAGVALALQVLDGKVPPESTALVTPEVWANDTEAGKARLTEANDPDIDLQWPLMIDIPGRTTYTKDQLVACMGPQS